MRVLRPVQLRKPRHLVQHARGRTMAASGLTCKLRWLLIVSLASAPVGLAAAKQVLSSPEQRFLNDSDAAMASMMRGMSVQPSGDVDRDFANMMIPHHQGAIDMAVSELRYGRNEQLRRIAQEIVIDQQSEIAAMRLALGLPLSASAAAPTVPAMPKEK